jgi:hypothetical protein
LAALQRTRGGFLRLLGAALRLRDLLAQAAASACLCGALGDTRGRVRLHGVLRSLHPRLLEAGKLLIVGLPRLLAGLRRRIVLLPNLVAAIGQGGRRGTWCGRGRCAGRRFHHVAESRGLDFPAIWSPVEHRRLRGAFRALVGIMRGGSTGPGS